MNLVGFSFAMAWIHHLHGRFSIFFFFWWYITDSNAPNNTLPSTKLRETVTRYWIKTEDCFLVRDNPSIFNGINLYFGSQFLSGKSLNRKSPSLCFYLTNCPDTWIAEAVIERPQSRYSSFFRQIIWRFPNFPECPMSVFFVPGVVSRSSP